MARPRKKGLDYFTNDVNFYQDVRIRKLIHRKGIQAVSVYHVILCKIYSEGYYIRWDEDFPFIIHEICCLDEDVIQDVILYCTEIGLFSKVMFENYQVLTSKGIQKRYFAINGMMKRKMESTFEYSLLLTEPKIVSPEKTKVISEETQVISEETSVIPEEILSNGVVSSEKMPQIKEKKMKGKHPTGVFPMHTHTHDEPVGRWSGGDAAVYDSVDEEVQVLRNSPLWKEQVLLRFKFLNRDERALDEYLERWCQEVKISAKTHQCLGDAKWHFSNWMVINENKFNNKTGSHYGANNNNGYRSREDIIGGAMRIVSELRAEGRQPKEELPVV